MTIDPKQIRGILVLIVLGIVATFVPVEYRMQTTIGLALIAAFLLLTSMPEAKTITINADADPKRRQEIDALESNLRDASQKLADGLDVQSARQRGDDPPGEGHRRGDARHGAARGDAHRQRRGARRRRSSR